MQLIIRITKDNKVLQAPRQNNSIGKNYLNEEIKETI